MTPTPSPQFYVIKDRLDRPYKVMRHKCAATQGAGATGEQRAPGRGGSGVQKAEWGSEHRGGEARGREAGNTGGRGHRVLRASCRPGKRAPAVLGTQQGARTSLVRCHPSPVTRIGDPVTADVSVYEEPDDAFYVSIGRSESDRMVFIRTGGARAHGAARGA